MSRRIPIANRMLGKYIVSLIKFHNGTPCWLWTASLDSNGYGKIGGSGGKGSGWLLAHRASYEIHIGPIAEGLTLDHLCRVPRCINPLHLEPVTNKENLRRGRSGINSGGKTHCPQGHAYDMDNTYVYRHKTGKLNRMCRTCDRRKHRK